MLCEWVTRHPPPTKLHTSKYGMGLQAARRQIKAEPFRESASILLPNRISMSRLENGDCRPPLEWPVKELVVGDLTILTSA
mmetsp:Transcript_24786/g.45573  ORF Transcript_24786/g.45573 Transcript_24786/m.45573 type:complete len:81 (+) Transcript_24786:115-357(+)